MMKMKRKKTRSDTTPLFLSVFPSFFPSSEGVLPPVLLCLHARCKCQVSAALFPFLSALFLPLQSTRSLNNSAIFYVSPWFPLVGVLPFALHTLCLIFYFLFTAAALCPCSCSLLSLSPSLFVCLCVCLSVSLSDYHCLFICLLFFPLQTLQGKVVFFPPFVPPPPFFCCFLNPSQLSLLGFLILGKASKRK